MIDEVAPAVPGVLESYELVEKLQTKRLLSENPISLIRLTFRNSSRQFDHGHTELATPASELISTSIMSSNVFADRHEQLGLCHCGVISTEISGLSPQGLSQQLNCNRNSCAANPSRPLILTVPSPLCLQTRSALIGAFAQSNGQVVAVHSTAAALALAFISSSESKGYARELLAANSGVIRLLVLEVGEDFVGASIVEVGAVMPDPSFKSRSSLKDPIEVQRTGTGTGTSSLSDTATPDSKEPYVGSSGDIDSIRSMVIDVMASVGTSHLGLKVADEACLAAWMTIGSGDYSDCSDSDSDSGKNVFVKVPVEGLAVARDPWPLLSEETRRACLLEMEIFRSHVGSDVSLENGGIWADSRAGEEDSHSNGRDISIVSGAPANTVPASVCTSTSVTVSGLCNRLLGILTASGVNLAFNSPHTDGSIQRTQRSCSDSDFEAGRWKAAVAALIAALSSYGRSEIPKFNIETQMLDFMKIALSKSRQADEESSALHHNPAPSPCSSIDSVLVWSAFPETNIPFPITTLPLRTTEEVFEVEKENGEDQGWQSTIGNLILRLRQMVNTQLVSSSYKGLRATDSIEKQGMPSAISAESGIIRASEKEKIGDDSESRDSLHCGSCPNASISAHGLLSSSPFSVRPPVSSALKIFCLSRESVVQGSRELSALYDFRHLMTSGVRTSSTVVRVYESVASSSTYGLCLRCTSSLRKEMREEDIISGDDLEEDISQAGTIVQLSNVVRMDRVQSSTRSGEHFKVVLEGLSPRSQDRLGTSFDTEMAVTLRAVRERTDSAAGGPDEEEEEEEEEDDDEEEKIGGRFSNTVHLGEKVGLMSLSSTPSPDLNHSIFCDWAVLIVEQRDCDDMCCSNSDTDTPEERHQHNIILGTISLTDCPSAVCLISLVREMEGGLFSIQADYVHSSLIPTPMDGIQVQVHSIDGPSTATLCSMGTSSTTYEPKEEVNARGKERERGSTMWRIFPTHSPQITEVLFSSYKQDDAPSSASVTKERARSAGFCAFLCLRIIIKATLYCIILFLATKTCQVFTLSGWKLTVLGPARFQDPPVMSTLPSTPFASDITTSHDNLSYCLSGQIFPDSSLNVCTNVDGDNGGNSDIMTTKIVVTMVAGHSGQEDGKGLIVLIPPVTLISPISRIKRGLIASSSNLKMKMRAVQRKVLSLAYMFLGPVHFLLDALSVMALSLLRGS